MFHYTVETMENVPRTIAELEKSLYEEQFGVLWKFNLHDKLREKGFEFEHQYVVLEVCNPAEASRVINENGVLMNLMQDDTLRNIASDVEARLIDCINRVVKQ